MKTLLSSLVLTLLFAPGLVHVYGQTRKCGTPDLDIKTPSQLTFNQNASIRSRKITGTPRVIPIAVHIIYDQLSSNHNISDAQVASQISVLNNDFRGVSGGVDTEIEFCLSGIRRVQSSQHSNVSIDAIDAIDANDVAMKALSQEDPNLFLNVWIVNSISGSVLGFSTFPGDLNSFPALDGVVISDHYWGTIGTAANSNPFNLGRTATHEIGHWLNLIHVFQGGCDENSTCGFEGDCCCDTPPQKEAYRKCKKKKNSCHDDSPDEKDPIRNYLGYSDDECMNNFTACQSSRMNLALDSVRFDSWFLKGGECPSLKSEFTHRNAFDNLIEVTAFPNPFTTTSTLMITLKEKLAISIDLFDIKGSLLRSVQAGIIMEPGVHEIPLGINRREETLFVRVRSGVYSRTLVLIQGQ